MPGDYDAEYASPWAGAHYLPLVGPTYVTVFHIRVVYLYAVWFGYSDILQIVRFRFNFRLCDFHSLVLYNRLVAHLELLMFFILRIVQTSACVSCATFPD